MRKQIFGLAVLFAAGLLAVGMVGAPAGAAPSVIGTVTVTGAGSMTVNRDQATTSISVSNLESTAKLAMATTTSGYNALRAALLSAGVKTDGITTSGVSLYPEYDYNVMDKAGHATLRGYRAIISMSVVTTIPLAATVLDTAVNVGGDAVQIGGVSFDVANPDAVTDTSRARAVANAKLKAQDYAQALGERIGRATKVVETNAAVPVPVYYAAKTGLGGADTVNVDPGTQKLTSNVTITFELLG